MACVASDPKVSVHAAPKGAPSGRARDWQPGTGLPSSLNETVPVGGAEPADAGVTVAVSVTGCPASGLGTEGVIARVVGSGRTTCVKTVDVLAPNSTSPP